MTILAGAIAESHIHDPLHPRGGTWDNTNLSPEEAQHYAKAALTALAKNHFKIVEAK
jgi:hypothetical protein